ncbi:MAG TPA: hypothetical protein VFC23_04165 [Thermoanaerobaculia bacterium]|nr:hypothetical protein [Thermoanaerobaculia bacterium]
MEPQSPPPPASPFGPAPRPVAPQGGGGCSKPLIVGCVVVFLVGAIALLGGLYYVTTHAAALLQWSFQQTETSLLAQLPKDVTPEEKANLQQAFADVRQALRDGKVPLERLQPLQFKILEITRKGSSVTRQDVLDLNRAMEEAVGKGGGPVPAPAGAAAPRQRESRTAPRPAESSTTLAFTLQRVGAGLWRGAHGPAILVAVRH